MNTVYQAHTIHRRVSICPTCQNVSIKTGFAFRKYNPDYLFSYDFQKESFEKFAIAWG